MFSAALEIVLTIAYREAVSRKHAYLTLEHLLFALGQGFPRLWRSLAFAPSGEGDEKTREPRQGASQAFADTQVMGNL